MTFNQVHATTSCKSTWDTVPYFGINGLSMILCLWSSLHPLSKLLAIQDHTQNLEEQLWMGGRREVSIIFHRPVTRSDLKQERSFFPWECLIIFATGCSTCLWLPKRLCESIKACRKRSSGAWELLIQRNPDFSNLQGKRKLVREIGSSRNRKWHQITLNWPGVVWLWVSKIHPF